MEKLLRANKMEVQLASAPLTPEELVDIYSDIVYRFCRKLTYSKEDAEDLFQETFLKVFEQLPKVNSCGSTKNFIFSTALFLWKSSKRKYARRNRLAPVQPLSEEIVSDTGVEDGILAQEDIRLVRQLTAALPEKYKVPTILHYTAEMSLQDIATTLKIPVGTVKSRLHKARKIIEKGLIGFEK